MTFRERVPVQQYEMLRPYIERAAADRRARADDGGAALLRADERQHRRARSTFRSRRSMLAIHRAEQALFSYLQYPRVPGRHSTGKAWASWARRSRAISIRVTSVGSVSGHLYRSLPRVIQSRFVVPPEVSSIADYDLKYLVILRLALGEPEITYIGSPNPSTFLRLLDLLNERREMLLRTSGHGNVRSLIAALEPSLRRALPSG